MPLDDLHGAMSNAAADDAFVSNLLALASANRLSILRQLLEPRVVREIVVRERTGDGVGPPLARQTVRRHLDTLMEAGIVAKGSDERDEGEMTVFVLNHQRIYDLSEELRNLARLRPTVEPEQQTVPARPAAPAEASGPCLVLVKGLDEGKRFDLSTAGWRTGWTIGRRRGIAVSLDYDAAVSSENAILRALPGGGHAIEDVAGSRNGTYVNHRRLDPGERHPLRRGDIIGVGRSLLVYWA